jgi:kynureninase
VLLKSERDGGTDGATGPSTEALAGLLSARPDLARRLALVSFSHVDYRLGALADMAAVNRLAHDAGALTLWDLSHSVGAVPIDLTGSPGTGEARSDGPGDGADLAVGCTYKYLNSGPGAPAFLYVRREHQARLRQPIQGWFGQRDQFAMGPNYDPAPGIDGFLTGTTPVLGAITLESSVGLLSEIGIARLRERSLALTSWLIDLTDAMLVPLGFTMATPRDPRRRGGHVALRHPDAYRISRALSEQALVVGDFREPDLLRLAPVAAYTTFTDVWDACDRIRTLVERGAHLRVDTHRRRVT